MPEPRDPLDPIEEFEGWEDGEYPEVSDELKRAMTQKEFEDRLDEIDEGKVVIEQGIYRVEIQNDMAVIDTEQNGRIVERKKYDSKTEDIDIIETWHYRDPKGKHPSSITLTYDVHKDR